MKSLPKPRGQPDASDKAAQRPDIFRFYDYRAFLKDWCDYLRSLSPDFSLRALATEAQLSPGYLALILAGKRGLSERTLDRIAPFLKLRASELSYLRHLISLNSPESIETQIKALSRMQRSLTFKKLNPKEVEFFEYMRHWFNVAIREMAHLPGFKLDPKWIQDHLRIRVPLSSIKHALELLRSNGLLSVDSNGEVVASSDLLRCDDLVLSKTLRHFHKQMLGLAVRSMSNTPASLRKLFGYTLTLDSSQFAEASQILDRAMAELESLEKRQGSRDAVYHLELAFFPLTKGSGT